MRIPHSARNARRYRVRNKGADLTFPFGIWRAEWRGHKGGLRANRTLAQANRMCRAWDRFLAKAQFHEARTGDPCRPVTL